MQEQHYENVSSESEREFIAQGVRDRWSEGEKLQVEPRHMGGLSSSLASILVVVIFFVLLAVFFFLAGVSIHHGAHIHGLPGRLPGRGPGPIQQP